MKRRKTAAKFLAILIAVLLIAPTQSFAVSGLETAINGSDSTYTMTTSQQISANLNELNRDFSVEANNFAIAGENHSGFKINTDSNFVLNNTGQTYEFSSENGGVIFVDDNATAALYGNDNGISFFDNSATGNGGVAAVTGDSFFLLQNAGYVLGNSAGGNGGVIYADNGATVSIVNTSMTDNSAQGQGGAVYVKDSNLIILAEMDNTIMILSNSGADIYADNSIVDLSTQSSGEIFVETVALTNSSLLNKTGNVSIRNLYIEDSSVNTADGLVTTVAEIENLNVFGDSSWYLDADLSSGLSDRVITAAGSGTLNLYINPIILGDYDTITIFDDFADLTAEIETHTTQRGSQAYSFTYSDGQIYVTEERDDRMTLNEAAKAYEDTTFRPESDYTIVTEDVGTLNNNLTIGIGKKVIDGDGHLGIITNGKNFTVSEGNRYFHGIIKNFNAGTGNGGFVNVNNNDTLNLSYVQFSSNSAVNGGAIYLSSATADLLNVYVTNNNVSGQGGGIYAKDSTVNIHSTGGDHSWDMVVQDNMVNGENNDIYSDHSSFTLYAREALTYIGYMTAVNNSTITVNGAPQSGSTVELNTLNLEGNSNLVLTRGSKNQANFYTKTLNLNSSNVYSQNGYIDTNTIHISTINVSGNSAWYLDTNLSTFDTDSLGTEFLHGSNLSLYINILDGTNMTGSITVFGDTTIIDDNLVIAPTESVYGDYKYTFTQDETNKGVLNYTSREFGTLPAAIADATISSYTLQSVNTVTKALGTLALTEQGIRDFTIIGNNSVLNSAGENRMGVVIEGSQDKFGTKFTVQDALSVSGFANVAETAKGSFISAQQADISILNSSINNSSVTATGNHPQGYAQGGAIYIENDKEDEQLHTTQIKDSNFALNLATSNKSYAQGGAIYSRFNNLNIDNTVFSSNTVQGFNNYTAGLKYGAAQGGAVHFENNKIGGGVVLKNVTLSIKDSVFENNVAISTKAAAYGGALSIVGNTNVATNATIENTIFRNNNVTGKDSFSAKTIGAAIYNENAILTLKNVTFSSNTATVGENTVFSDIANVGDNGTLIFDGGTTSLQGGITNGDTSGGAMEKGGFVFVKNGAELTFENTATLIQADLIIDETSKVVVKSEGTDNLLQRLAISKGGRLTLNSDLELAMHASSGDSENNGTITNTGSFIVGRIGFYDKVLTNNGSVLGDGTMTVVSGVINNGTIENDIVLSNISSNLTSKYSSLGGNITINGSNAKFYMSGDANLKNADKISGNGGSLYISGNVVSNADLNYTGRVYLQDGAKLTKGTGNIFQTNAVVVGESDENSAVVTLNLLNGTQDNITYNDFTVARNSLLKIEMDWKDNFTVDSIAVLGNVNLSKIDISGIDDDSYEFAKNIKNKIKLTDINLITTEGNANAVWYDNSTGLLSAFTATLKNIISKISAAADPDGSYNYALNSNEAGNSNDAIIGEMKITGNGNSIINEGLIVGASSDNRASVVLEDASISNVKIKQENTGAITVNENSDIIIRAENQDVSLSGTEISGGATIKTAVYLNKGEEMPALARFQSNNGNVITIDDAIRSNNKLNRVNFEGGIINFNGTFENVDARVCDEVVVTRDGNDKNISWNIFDGTLSYKKDSYLSGNGNSITFDTVSDTNAGTLDLINGEASTILLDGITINSGTDGAKLMLDVDLKNKKMDNFGTTPVTHTQGKIHISKLNLVSDAASIKTDINFTKDETLLSVVDYTGEQKLAYSSLYEYDVNYDTATGNFGFVRSGGFNPVIIEGVIASAVGGFITETAVTNQIFSNIDAKKVSNNKKAQSKGLLYASAANQVFEGENSIERSLWLKPYAGQETVKLGDAEVDNTAMGTLAGIDLPIDEEKQVSFYLGYAGSNQKYEDIKVSQTGYILGATGMMIKDNWYAGLTANIIFNKASSESNYGTDDFDMNMYSVAGKAGYNHEINKNWTVEPSLMIMYGSINTASYETSQGANVDSQSLSNLLLNPQVKAKLNLNEGWQPYALVGYVLNTGSKPKVSVGNIELESDKIDGYVEYGVGVNKDFIGTVWSGYAQVTGRGGDRTGFSGNLGIKYKF